MMTVHPVQADPKWNHNRMPCRACVQLPLDMDGIDDSIYTQMLNPPQYLLVHLSALDYGRKSDIGTLKKWRGDTFS